MSKGRPRTRRKQHLLAEVPRVPCEGTNVGIDVKGPVRRGELLEASLWQFTQEDLAICTVPLHVPLELVITVHRLYFQGETEGRDRAFNLTLSAVETSGGLI